MKESDIHFRLSNDLKKQMQIWCKNHEMSISTLIRVAIIEFLERNK